MACAYKWGWAHILAFQRSDLIGLIIDGDHPILFHYKVFDGRCMNNQEKFMTIGWIARSSNQENFRSSIFFEV